MARIKSALELALERTEAVKGDRSSLEQFEARQEGKRLAGLFIEDSERSLAADLKGQPHERRDAVRKGALEVLLSQLSLPYAKEDLSRLKRIGEGVSAVTGERSMGQLFQQLGQALEQYLGDVEHYEQAIRQQFAPKLRQKEEEIARRTGRAVKIDPLQDPEFVAFYNQNMGNLRNRYQEAVDQVKAQIREMAGLE